MEKEGAVNQYTCTRCERTITTIIAEEEGGTTPAFTSCVFGCPRPAKMVTHSYRVPQEWQIQYEWYRPEITDDMDLPTRDHVERGGLVLRPVVQVNPRFVWIAGQYKAQFPAGAIWELQGVFPDETAARNACRQDNYFIFSIPFGQPLPHESVFTQVEYPLRGPAVADPGRPAHTLDGIHYTLEGVGGELEGVQLTFRREGPPPAGRYELEEAAGPRGERLVRRRSWKEHLFGW